MMAELMAKLKVKIAISIAFLRDLQVKIMALVRQTPFAQVGSCGLVWQENTLVLAHIMPATNNKPPIVKTCIALKNIAELTTYVSKNHLQGITCTWVMQPQEYQLILTDTLPVEETELAGALRWKAKELIDFPIEQAVVDYFQIAGGNNLPAQKLYIVIAKLAFLQTTSQLIKNSGLNLTCISIPEFSLRNIMALFPQESLALACIEFRQKDCLLIITYETQIYLTRVIKLILEPTPEAVWLDNLVLEIQRSFDYYQNQLHQAAPAKLFVTVNNTSLLTHLRAQLACPIEWLDLSKVLTIAEPLKESSENICIAAIGAALGNGGAHAAEN
jgi:MSHA biogenesis protein MshI